MDSLLLKKNWFGTYLLVCWIATPGKTNCLSSNNCSIQFFYCILCCTPMEHNRRVGYATSTLRPSSDDDRKYLKGVQDLIYTYSK